MSTKVNGILDADDLADTCTLWRRPGRYAYELVTRGSGAMTFRLEVRAGGPPGGWRPIEERSSVTVGSSIEGRLVVPEATPSSGQPPGPGWTELRFRIARVTPAAPVEYEFSLSQAD